MHVVATVLAHQGGWDEIAFIAGPVLVFAALLVVANRRASKLSDERTDGPSERETAEIEPATDDEA